MLWIKNHFSSSKTFHVNNVFKSVTLSKIVDLFNAIQLLNNQSNVNRNCEETFLFFGWGKRMEKQ
jgi:hypothetical protein